MFNTKKLIVKGILKESEQKVECQLEDGSFAIAYPQFTPNIKKGDEVVVNTTAVDLGLGTGGYHFVIHNLGQSVAGTVPDKLNRDCPQPGHIMKLRYAPQQFSILSVESPESEYHQLLKDKSSIKGLPVIIGSLHSQVPAAAATAKYLNPEIKITYIMTDGASLPLNLSDTVAELKEKNLIDYTITCAQAFGGDYEAVNIYSALLCAKYVNQADLVIVAMGPGVTGTGTKLGTTAIEVGQLINAVASLEGKSIVIPRISFRDKRQRHQGLSHHCLTALGMIAMAKAVIALPNFAKKEKNYIDAQIQKNKLADKHQIKFINSKLTEKALNNFGLKPTTMGRGHDEEPYFFQASSCAAIVALKMLKKSGATFEIR